MKVKNPYLNKLAGTHDKILVFDCEFWHVYNSKGFIPNKSDRSEFYMPREIGGFVFTKSADGNWTYRTHFFVTFYPPENSDVSFVSSHFSSVTEKTAKLMDEYQSLLNMPAESSYLATLPKELHEYLLADIGLYLNDENIRQAQKPHSWFRSFMKQYEDSVIVVKGTMDIDALKNACTAYNVPYRSPKKVVDIADWNRESHRLCKTAKLEKTFECIKGKLDSDIKPLLRILPIGKAHDPRADAAMTLIIALYIIQRK